MNRLHIGEHEQNRPRGLLISAYTARGLDINTILDDEGVSCIEELSEDKCQEILSYL